MGRRRRRLEVGQAWDLEGGMFRRILMVEDDEARVALVRSWLPTWARLVWAQSAGAAIGLIQRDAGRLYAGVLLDHDLGLRTKTEADSTLSGTDVTKALLEKFSSDIPILVHSMNSVRVPRLVRMLEDRGFWVTAVPFEALTQQVFRAWIDEIGALREEDAD